MSSKVKIFSGSKYGRYDGYGNRRVNIEPTAGLDRPATTDIQSNESGVSYMRIKAERPEPKPGETVSALVRRNHGVDERVPDNLERLTPTPNPDAPCGPDLWSVFHPMAPCGRAERRSLGDCHNIKDDDEGKRSQEISNPILVNPTEYCGSMSACHEVLSAADVNGTSLDDGDPAGTLAPNDPDVYAQVIDKAIWVSIDAMPLPGRCYNGDPGAGLARVVGVVIASVFGQFTFNKPIHALGWTIERVTRAVARAAVALAKNNWFVYPPRALVPVSDADANDGDDDL